MIFFGYQQKKIDYYELLQKRRKRISSEEAIATWFYKFTEVRRRKLRKLCISQGWKCFYCEKIVAHRKPGKKGGRCVPTLEHLFQVSHGGTDSYCNLVMACGDCNSRRGSLPAYQYMDLVKSGWRNFVEDYNKTTYAKSIEPAKLQRRDSFVIWLAYLMLITPKISGLHENSINLNSI